MTTLVLYHTKEHTYSTQGLIIQSHLLTHEYEIRSQITERRREVRYMPILRLPITTITKRIHIPYRKSQV